MFDNIEPLFRLKIMNAKTISLLLIVLFSFAVAADAQVKMPENKAIVLRGKSEPLKVGETAPDFTLNDTSGKTITLSKAKMPVVLVFHRGYW